MDAAASSERLLYSHSRASETESVAFVGRPTVPFSIRFNSDNSYYKLSLYAVEAIDTKNYNHERYHVNKPCHYK